MIAPRVLRRLRKETPKELERAKRAKKGKKKGKTNNHDTTSPTNRAGAERKKGKCWAHSNEKYNKGPVARAKSANTAMN